MGGQDPNLAPVDGSAALVSPSLNGSSGSSLAGGNNSTSTAIHNAILLGWSIMELKSRVQITASNLLLDSIVFDQQSSSFVASITGPLTSASAGNQQPQPAIGTGDQPSQAATNAGNQQAQPTAGAAEQQPDAIDSLLKNVVLNDIESLLSQGTANGVKAISAKAQSLSTELRDNEWLTSVMREIFRRIVTLHLQRFPDSDTTDTIYDINPPTPPESPDYDDTDFPYLYLYPGKLDYANVGVRIIKPGKTGNDCVIPFVQNFRLYDVTRRALNCLTLLWTSADEALDPMTIECYQKELVPRILGVSPLTTAFPEDLTEEDQPVLVEPACEDLPVPSDTQIKEAIKALSSLVIRLLEAWDGFLRESFFVDIDSPNNEIELLAYEAGRSLAALTWGVSVALVPLENSIQLTSDQQKNSDIGGRLTKKVRDTWMGIFNERDINYLQLRISALSKALDRMSDGSIAGTNLLATSGSLVSPGQAVHAVNESLEYWQRAVAQMCKPAPAPTADSTNSDIVRPLLMPMAAPAHPPSSDAEPLLPLQWGTQAQALRLALIKQADLWRTLILGQRDLRTFTMDNVSQKILNDFMQDLEHATSNEFLRLRKRGLNAVGVILIIGLIVLGLVLAALFVPQIRDLNTGQITNPLTLVVLLWGGVAAFVSSVMGRLGDALTRFGPAGTAVADSFEQGYNRVLLEFDDLNHNVAITNPLIEFFALQDWTVLVESPSGEKVEKAIKDGYDFLAYVFWTDEDRKDEIKQVARAAFGPIGAFVGSELKFEQNPKGGSILGSTPHGKVMANPKSKTR